MPLGQYHVKIVDLMDIERDLIRALLQDGRLLRPRQEAILRWAIALGRTCLFRTPEGRDVDLSEPLAPYRQWLIENLRAAIPSGSSPDGPRLRLLTPSVELRLRAARQLVLTRHLSDFGAEHLDEELRFRKLALALGGGGGAGFAHLGVFKLMEELNLTPELLVGASMGSLMGLFRAIERPYSHVAAVQTIPRNFDLTKIFRPFNGVTRFGLPGAFHMQMIRTARQALENFVGRSRIPVFEELPIRLEVVVTGVRTGFAENPLMQQGVLDQGVRKITNPFSMRRWLKLSFQIARELTSNPKLLKQLVFGREPGTRQFNTVEAVGFSCAVPGLFCYDVFHDDPTTIQTLDSIVERHRIWRMTDGGVVNNVPARVAWESVMQGNLGTRNVYIFASDVFAPTNSPRNLPFTPIQQIARQNVMPNRAFSDYTKTFQAPPSPLNLSPSQPQLERIVDKARAELDTCAEHVARATSPLPIYGSWNR